MVLLQAKVFVQQTMKTAGSDEELAFKQKEKDPWGANRL